MADCPQILQIIAIHGGAGFHPKSTDPDVKRALRLACTSSGMAFTRTGETALPMVCGAVSVLEDDQCLNAGCGSNLTLSGTVECDASVMDGNTGDFGAVGSVSDVKNPIRLAHEILRYSRKLDPLGRIPPLLLVSSGASEFAKSTGLQCLPESLITIRARREWADWKSKLDAARSCASSGGPPNSTGQPATSLIHTDGLHDKQDTVGAVAWDAEGHLAAGVSSGGLLLKLPGRIGEAATYGAGCWATPRTACSVSGAGEHITRMSLARTICEAIEAAGINEDTHDVLQRVLGGDFLRLCSERGERTPQAGVLLLVKEVRPREDSESSADIDMESDSEGGKESDNPAVCNAGGGGGESSTTFKPRLWCAFTTESMAVGYATSLCPKPSAAVLRRPPRGPGASQGPSVYITALPLDR
ncbi:hypothetical protein V8D89_014746 [Ganoderma adspersum]